MMNYIFSFMLLAGIFFSLFKGTLSQFTDSLFQSCTQAVEFAIGLAGIMAVWSGIMKIAERSGLIDMTAAMTKPLMNYLFPHHVSRETTGLMLMSFMANIFGAGSSATVFSLKAMARLDGENQYSDRASNTMCMFAGLSMSMLQLVPITLVKIRSDMGSVSPESIIVPSIIVGILSMLASVIVCKIYEKRDGLC